VTWPPMNHSSYCQGRGQEGNFHLSDHKGCWGSFSLPLWLKTWSPSWMSPQMRALLMSGPDTSAWLLTISTSKLCSPVGWGYGMCCDVVFLVDCWVTIKEEVFMNRAILSIAKCLFHASLVTPQPSEYPKLKEAIPEQQQNQECK